MILFKRKKYKIQFTKTRFYKSADTWYEIKDAYIIKILKDLQAKFDFKIISINLKQSFDTSKIVIRCNKVDKYKIFMEFVGYLSGKIEKVKM